jgi:hypothetical protein
MRKASMTPDLQQRTIHSLLVLETVTRASRTIY